MAFHHDDSGDPYIPLLVWWAIESKVKSDPDVVVELLASPEFWNAPVARASLIKNIARRFAATGKPQDLGRCATLFSFVLDEEGGKLFVQGVTEAFQGRAMMGLPE